MRKIPPGCDFDRAEAADYVGVTVSTLNSWALQKRHLPYTKIGGKAWYRKPDCDAYLRKQVVNVVA